MAKVIKTIVSLLVIGFLLILVPFVLIQMNYLINNPSEQIVTLINPSSKDIDVAIHTDVDLEKVVRITVPPHSERSQEFHIQGDAGLWISYQMTDSSRSIVSDDYYVTGGRRTVVKMRLDAGKPFLVRYD